MSSSIGVAGPPSSRATDRTLTASHVRKYLIIFAVCVGLLVVAGVFCVKYWPFSENSVREDLAEASDSVVTIRSYHPTYFPPGCTLEGVEFRHGKNNFKLITIKKLVVEGSYLGIVRRHVPRIIADGARVFVPPFGANVQFHSQHSSIVVDELIANGTGVEFISADRKTSSLIFDVHEALLRSVRWGSPIAYRLKFHNPNPPGEISVEGRFGAWADGHPQDTPMSGNYTFENADLGVYGGIAGTLSLMVLAPPLAEIALSFSTFEYFWLAFLGLMCATLVARSSPVKAIAAMLIGLLVACIGIAGAACCADKCGRKKAKKPKKMMQPARLVGGAIAIQMLVIRMMGRKGIPSEVDPGIRYGWT